MPFDQIRNQVAGMGLSKPDGFNPYAAGDKQYGLSGRPNATTGPIGFEGMKGYAERDKLQAAKRQAMLNKMQAAQKGQYMSPSYLKGIS
jgi:hypothetical protein